MSNYHRLHCATCDERCDRPAINWGKRALSELLAVAPAVAAFDLELPGDFFWSLHGPGPEGAVNITWLVQHLEHAVHVCCEYSCPCACES